jgi:hypothetical protein
MMTLAGRGNVLRKMSKFALIALCNVQLAALVVFSLVVPKAMGAETAAELASICMPIAQTPPASDGELHFKPTFDNGRCWGAFAAIQSLSRIKSTLDKPPLLGICAPAQTTRRELVKAFMDYVGSHPELRTQDFSVAVIVALRSQYPCGNSQ